MNEQLLKIISDPFLCSLAISREYLIAYKYPDEQFLIYDLNLKFKKNIHNSETRFGLSYKNILFSGTTNVYAIPEKLFIKYDRIVIPKSITDISHGYFWTKLESPRVHQEIITILGQNQATLKMLQFHLNDLRIFYNNW